MFVLFVAFLVVGILAEQHAYTSGDTVPIMLQKIHSDVSFVLCFFFMTCSGLSCLFLLMFNVRWDNYVFVLI
jgi:hypothetical protein